MPNFEKETGCNTNIGSISSSLRRIGSTGLRGWTGRVAEVGRVDSPIGEGDKQEGPSADSRLAVSTSWPVGCGSEIESATAESIGPRADERDKQPRCAPTQPAASSERPTPAACPLRPACRLSIPSPPSLASVSGRGGVQSLGSGEGLVT